MTSSSRNINLIGFCFMLNLLLSVISAENSVQVELENSQQIFILKRVIDTEMELTKSLAISPLSTQVIVGGRDGILKVFNYESGQQVWEQVQNSTQITAILWQNYHEGLVTISSNHSDNYSSLAIQRNSINFSQTYSWSFPQFIYNADSISNRHQSYIAFNFMNRVQEYHLKTHKKSTTYLPTQNRLFVQMSYSSQYSYLYLSGFGQYMYAFKCGTIYRFYYGTNDIITRFQADKSNTQHAPVIYKKQYEGFQILDPNYQFNVSFPNQKINFFKYCPRDFILGVGIDDSIKIYSRDYKFAYHGQIDTFVNQDFYILSVLCQNDHIIVTASNDKIYVFGIQSKQRKVSEGWIWVVAIGGGVTLLLVIVAVCVVKKVRSKSKVKRIDSPSLLTSEPKSSVVSQFLN